MRKLLPMFFFSVVALSDAYACDPCKDTLNLEQTMGKADVIAFGERTTPLQPEEYKHEGGPEWVDVKLREVLKGDAKSGSSIKVKSWSQMCQYGISSAVGETEVLFLTKTKDGYNTVNDGCAIKSLKMDGVLIVTPDGPVMLDKFKSMVK